MTKSEIPTVGQRQSPENGVVAVASPVASVRESAGKSKWLPAQRASRRGRRLFLAYLGLLTCGAFTALPFAWMIVTSMQDGGQVLRIPPNFIPDLLFQGEPFRNYRELLLGRSFDRYLVNSLFIAGMAGLGQIICSALAGFAFAKMRFRGGGFVFAALLSTMMIPVEVTIIPEFFLMSRMGWIDSYLPLIVPSFLLGAFGTFMMREFFKSIPDELVEAARVDGASPLRIFWSIFLPLSKPALITLFLVAFINNWNELLRPVLYVRTQELRPITIGLASLRTEYGTDWNLLMAGSVLAILPMIVMYIFFQRFIIEGFATSGIK